MATFVHIAPHKAVRSISRNGIKAAQTWMAHVSGVYAMPVVLNFYRTHQWMRELKRSGQRVMHAVYFRIPDAETVWVGRYNQEHEAVTVAQAVARLLDETTDLGFEVIIPRAIAATEIRTVRHLPHSFGWRYQPGAHGKKPCGCPACLGIGAIKSRRIRDVYEAEFRA